MIVQRWIALAAAGLMLAACSEAPTALTRNQQPKPEPTQPSTIKVETNSGGPVVLTTTGAEFRVSPDGYVQAALLKDGQKLSLDDPRIGAPADSFLVRVGGKDLHFGLEFGSARVLDAIGKMGGGEEIGNLCAAARAFRY